MIRRLLFASVLLLAACGDKQQVDQRSTGDLSPNVVNGDVNQNVNVQLSKEAEARLVQSLIDKGVPAADRAAELEALKRKYADLEQRLGAYAKTDELAQQARKELDAGNLEQAETLLQQAYDQDLKLSQQRLAQRAFDLAEVAELRLDHDKALTRYREVTQLDPENLQAWKSLLEIANKVGNNNLALEASHGLTQHAGKDKSWLAVALVDEGDALVKLGDNKAALTKYQESHKLRETLATADPTNNALQQFLSVSFNRIGDLNKANGDTAAALKSYQDSLAIAQKLVALDPKQAEWQRDLSVSYERIGNLYQANGDTAAALKSYQDSLAIAQKLVALDPQQAEWQTDIVVSYFKLSTVESAKQTQYLQAALKILQQLHAEQRLSKDKQAWIGIIESQLKQ